MQNSSWFFLRYPGNCEIMQSRKFLRFFQSDSDRPQNPNCAFVRVFVSRLSKFYHPDFVSNLSKIKRRGWIEINSVWKRQRNWRNGKKIFFFQSKKSEKIKKFYSYFYFFLMKNENETKNIFFRSMLQKSSNVVWSFLIIVSDLTKCFWNSDLNAFQIWSL